MSQPWQQPPSGTPYPDGSPSWQQQPYGPAPTHGPDPAYGQAPVHEQAHVYGQAPVHGQAPVYGQPPQYGPPPPPPPAYGPAPDFGVPDFDGPDAPAPPRPGPGAVPPPSGPAPRRPGRPAAGLLAGLGAALLAVVVYAAILRFTDREIGYVALVAGLLVGVATGRAGGRAPALPAAGAVLSLLAVWFGQLAGMAWVISHRQPALSFGYVFFQHFGLLVRDWQHNFVDAKDVLFFAIAGAEGFVVTRRTARG